MEKHRDGQNHGVSKVREASTLPRAYQSYQKVICETPIEVYMSAATMDSCTYQPYGVGSYQGGKK